eukprot:12973136-Alexandrium_andersonii.AAC.1
MHRGLAREVRLQHLDPVLFVMHCVDGVSPPPAKLGSEVFAVRIFDKVVRHAVVVVLPAAYTIGHHINKHWCQLLLPDVQEKRFHRVHRSESPSQDTGGQTPSQALRNLAAIAILEGSQNRCCSVGPPPSVGHLRHARKVCLHAGQLTFSHQVQLVLVATGPEDPCKWVPGKILHHFVPCGNLVWAGVSATNPAAYVGEPLAHTELSQLPGHAQRCMTKDLSLIHI